MNTDIFPFIYERQLAREAEQKKSAAEAQYHVNREKIEQSRGSFTSDTTTILTVILLGGVGGFFACLVSGNYFMHLGAEMKSSVYGLAVWAAVFVLSIIIGKALDNREYQKFREKYEAVTARLTEEESLKEQKLAEIDAEARQKAARYSAAFERNAQTLSTRFAESDLAKELVEKLSGQFISAVRFMTRSGADRTIAYPLSMKVYKNKIEWNGGSFDFNVNRCRNLTSPLEQTALAIAIISQVQLNVTMAMPLHASDESAGTQVSYSYTDEYPIATITYAAVNGNYVALKEW